MRTRETYKKPKSWTDKVGEFIGTALAWAVIIGLIILGLKTFQQFVWFMWATVGGM